jgi:hypothetical protein
MKKEFLIKLLDKYYLIYQGLLTSVVVFPPMFFGVSEKFDNAVWLTLLIFFLLIIIQQIKWNHLSNKKT